MRFSYIALATAMVLAGCSGGADDVEPPVAPIVQTTTTVSAAPTSTSTTTSPPTTAPAPTTTATAAPLPVAIGSWMVLDVDPATFGDSAVVAAVEVEGRVVAVGCRWWDSAETGFPAWTSTEPDIWTRAVGPLKVGPFETTCLYDVLVTPFGLFAQGLALFGSSDGVEWEAVELRNSDGYSAGYVTEMWFSGDKLIVLLNRGAEAESTIATLMTTSDGVIWTEASREAAAVFDNGGIAEVVPTADGLLAVGASPWGEFVPTATAWISDDGIAWTVVTPGGRGFDDAYMSAVVDTGSGFIAVGGSPFDTSLTAIWSSDDGTDWQRLPDPRNDTAAEHGYMEALVAEIVNGTLYAAGRDYDAGRRPESEQNQPALWMMDDDGLLVRINLEERPGLVPFSLVTSGDSDVGFWPPPHWQASEPVRVLVRSRL